MPGTILLGVVNRNPLNLKDDPRDPWLGSLGSDTQGHAIFDREEYALRAAVRSLAQKWANGPICLLTLIGGSDKVNGWAEAQHGNKPEKYAKFLAKEMHVGGSLDELEIFDEDGNITDHDLLVELIEAMAQMEICAGWSISGAVIDSGIALYCRDYKVCDLP